MSSHKTPYEIRLNLLELASRIEKDRLQAEWAKTADSDNPICTLAPTVDDVMKIANKMNEFVSEAKETRGNR